MKIKKLLEELEELWENDKLTAFEQCTMDAAIYAIKQLLHVSGGSEDDSI